MYRDNTKIITIGNRKIGGGNPILIQSMTNTKTEDVEATVNQIKAFIEPVMIVTLAAIVGVVLLSVILPMFDMYQQIG